MRQAVISPLTRLHQACSLPFLALASAAQIRPFASSARLTLPLPLLPFTSVAAPLYRSPRLIRYKSKKASAREINDSASHDFEAESDRPVIKTKGKGGKGFETTSRKDDAFSEGEYDQRTFPADMKRAVQRCKDTVTQMVGMQGRADPALLDSVKVALPSDPKATSPLRDFASVGTRDGALLVTCFDKDMVKHVERAIHVAELGLTPQTDARTEQGILKIPIPRPTAESRTRLVREIGHICEKTRTFIRGGRHNAQKAIKKDVDSKFLSGTEGTKELKKLDEETKSWQREVDDFYSKLKKKIETERDG